ncbi:NADH-quinone oxidoreductase subunit N [Thermofilum pendens]
MNPAQTVTAATGLLAAVAALSPYFKGKTRQLLALTLLGVALAALAELHVIFSGGLSQGELLADRYAALLALVFLLDLSIVLLGSSSTVAQYEEGNALIGAVALAAAGLLGISVSGTVPLLLVSWVLVSAASYASIALPRDKYSASGASKYGLMSLASSMLLLTALGLASFNSPSLSLPSVVPAGREVAALALAFTVASVGFKAGAFPFHAWLPDTYGVSDPYPVSIVAPLSKGAVLLAFYKVSAILAPEARQEWLWIVGLIALLTMTYGNITALLQRGFQGLLAYSSIAHAGYLLVGVAALSSQQAAPTALYGLVLQLAAYSFAKTGLFLLARLARAREGPPVALDDLRGLSTVDKPLAASATILVLSLMGMPPLAGFWGKLFIFLAAVGPAPWLTAVALINTGIAAAYYARIIKAVYFEPGKPHLYADRGLKVVIVVTAAASLLAGLVPLVLPPA